ncbi:MAG: hypothetical protein Q8R15_03965 [Candidatus Micrarchaeota archaeon]|nr:hypothetical protein [Candidatus Micrarchaeota archaeon]
MPTESAREWYQIHRLGQVRETNDLTTNPDAPCRIQLDISAKQATTWLAQHGRKKESFANALLRTAGEIATKRGVEVEYLPRGRHQRNRFSSDMLKFTKT